MKRNRLLAAFLALCLLLCSCAISVNTPQSNPSVPSDQQANTPNTGSSTPGTGNDTENDTGDETPAPIYPAELTVELVVEWDKADTLLSQLDSLADLLRTALEEAGCPLDSVTLTLSTAGGFTAQTLNQGGIDAAILPSVDIITYENRVKIIALSGEDIPEAAVAVSDKDEALSQEFCTRLFDALTQTQAGESFLAVCREGAAFHIPTEDALQAVRDYRVELEKSSGGHEE